MRDLIAEARKGHPDLSDDTPFLGSLEIFLSYLKSELFSVRVCVT